MPFPAGILATPTLAETASLFGKYQGLVLGPEITHGVPSSMSGTGKTTHWFNRMLWRDPVWL
jgi:hypothetical protein